MSKLFLLCIFLSITLHAMQQSPFELCPDEIIEKIIHELVRVEESNINLAIEKNDAGNYLYNSRIFFEDEFSPFDTKKPIKKKQGLIAQFANFIKNKINQNSHDCITINGRTITKNKLTLILGTHGTTPTIFRSLLGIQQIANIKNFGFTNKRIYGLVNSLIYGKKSQQFIPSIITTLALKMAVLAHENIKTEIHNTNDCVFINSVETLQAYVAAHIDETKDCQYLKKFLFAFELDGYTNVVSRIFNRGRYSHLPLALFYPNYFRNILSLWEKEQIKKICAEVKKRADQLNANDSLNDQTMPIHERTSHE